MATTYLHRTPSVGGDRDKWTFATWIKRSKTDTNESILGAFSDGSNHTQIFWRGDNLEFTQKDGGVVTALLQTTRVFRDPTAWYHLVCVWDSGNAEAGDRMRIYVNGVEETVFNSDTNPSLNLDSFLNSTSYANEIGAAVSTEYFSGAMAHTHFCDGQAYAASDFGEFDSTSGIWVAKTSPSVTYGTNGFFLKYASGASGTDSSGNGNNMTVSGTITQTKDTPDNNFCTINPLDDYYPDYTFSNGNNKITTHAGNENYTTSTVWLGAGRWYWEVLVDTSSGNGPDVGYIDKVTSGTSNYLGQASGAAWRWDGNLRVNNSYASGTFATYTSGDYLGFYLDLEDNKIYVAKNGTIQNSGTGIAITAAASVVSGTGLYTPAFGDEHSTSSTYSANFGNGSFGSTQLTGTTYSDDDSNGTFKYSPNDGGASSFDGSAKNFYAICTNNLATYGG